MEELVQFFSNLTHHLNLVVVYVSEAIESISVYIPAFFGSEIGALVVVAAGVSLVLIVTGRG